MNEDYQNPWDEGGALASDWSYENAAALSTSSVTLTSGNQGQSKNSTPTYEQWLFIDMLIQFGGLIAKANQLPPAAMVACAIEESGYGKSPIYKQTGCPFNLQRPNDYTWVNCPVAWLETCTKTDDKNKCIETKKAPFCRAVGNDEGERLSDASRIWCEWILGYPNPDTKGKLSLWRDNPEEFTLNLPFFGFGEASKRKQNGEKFLAALRRHDLIARTANL